jgi:DNA-binding response OmpR family regulator
MPDKRPVVLLNDNEDTILVLADVLRDNGYSVEGFTDPALALRRLVEGEEPCMLVVDLKLRGMQGDEFIRTARAVGVTAPIVVITALSPHHIDVQALHGIGVAHVLVKPFGIDEICEVVEAFGGERCH